MKKILKSLLAILLLLSVAFADCEVPGDYNNDGALNVIDLVRMYHCGILIYPPPCEGEFSCNDNMDLNEDGFVNILDMVEMINLILGYS